MEILNYMQEENEITEVCGSVYTTTEITFKIRTEASHVIRIPKWLHWVMKEVLHAKKNVWWLIFEYTDRIDLQQKKVHRQNAPQEINCKENKSEESKGRVNELKTTEAFVKVAETKSFSEAAKQLFLTANYQRKYVSALEKNWIPVSYKKWQEELSCQRVEKSLCLCGTNAWNRKDK